MAVLSSCTIDPTEFHLTSMTLISSSSSSKPLESKALKSRDFLNAFELWSDGNISGKNQDCAEILFHALGDTYQQHHKQKLRQKYIDSFVFTRNIHSQKGKEGINAQRNALLKSKFNSNQLLQDVGSFNIPSLIIHGRNDSVFHWQCAIEMINILKRKSNSKNTATQLSIIEECDHMCWITHGIDVVAILGNFLNESKNNN